jgi:rhamnogalacturonan endolyase
VREPAGSTHFRQLVRRVAALPLGGGRVFVGWQQLVGEESVAGFHVYRSTRTDAAGDRVTSQPVTAATNFYDEAGAKAGRLYYRVRALDAQGREGPPSEWAAVEAGQPASNLVAVFEPTVKRGGFAPVFGDLDGDGVLDAVIRLDNGIQEMSRDPGVPVELEAFTSYGRALWRRPLLRHDQSFGSASNVPFVVFDLDGDGKSEVIARCAEGDKVYLAVLDGMTGRIRAKTPWTEMATDFAKSSTRIHLAVAYLDGKHPAIVTQTGLYENEIFDAYDARLNRLWQFRSFGETSGSGSHHIDVADVDGDGRDEIFDGTTLLGPDGKVRWSIYREHPDIVAVKHILPGTKERQVYYVVESAVHAGVYVVDARTGKIHWKVNREDDPRWTHGHIGWAADILESSPGMEMLANRDGHDANDSVLFDAQGKILMNPFPKGWRPADWTGGVARDMVSSDGRRIGRFTGMGVEERRDVAGVGLQGMSCWMSADLWGDYREELVCDGKTAEGNPAVFVFSNTAPAPRRDITRTASREYRVWLGKNRGGGYAGYFEWEKDEPTSSPSTPSPSRGTSGTRAGSSAASGSSAPRPGR